MTELNEELTKKTSVAVSVETRDLLAEIKEDRNQPDYDATIRLLMEQDPESKSDENMVHLEMTASKYMWLLAGQQNIDKSQCLVDAKR